MMDIFYISLLASACFCGAAAVELTIPVGVEGNDTVTFIREDDGRGNYDMGYNENVLTGGASFHRERGYTNGTRTGSYGYTTRNGLIRIVTYVADHDGYRAEVLTNEPGVQAYNPSNVTISKEQEPDPEALAQVPTGYINPQVAAADVVRSYVLSSADEGSSGGRYEQGHAKVAVSSPLGSYQYVL